MAVRSRAESLRSIAGGAPDWRVCTHHGIAASPRWLPRPRRCFCRRVLFDLHFRRGVRKELLAVLLLHVQPQVLLCMKVLVAEVAVPPRVRDQLAHVLDRVRATSPGCVWAGDVVAHEAVDTPIDRPRTQGPLSRGGLFA